VRLREEYADEYLKIIYRGDLRGKFSKGFTRRPSAHVSTPENGVVEQLKDAAS
jgi:hypothetical protein